jgi:hypothetical protein
MEDVCIFYGRMVYLTAVWNYCSHLVYLMVIGFFSRFGILYPEKSGNPASAEEKAAD